MQKELGLLILLSSFGLLRASFLGGEFLDDLENVKNLGYTIKSGADQLSKAPALLTDGKNQLQIKIVDALTPQLKTLADNITQINKSKADATASLQQIRDIQPKAAKAGFGNTVKKIQDAIDSSLSVLDSLGKQQGGVLPSLQAIIQDSVTTSNTAIQNLNTNIQKLRDALESQQGLFKGTNFIGRLNKLGNTVIDTANAALVLGRGLHAITSQFIGKVDDRPICFDCLKAPKDREGKFKDSCGAKIIKEICKNKYNVTWNY